MNVVDGQEKLALLLTVGQRNNCGGGDIGGFETVDDSHVETSRSEEVLEVGTVLRGLRLRNNILESGVIVGKIGDKLVTEHLQVFGEGRLVLNGSANREHVGEETDDLLELSHGTLGDSGTDDEQVLSGVLVQKQVVHGEESGERGGGGRGNVTVRVSTARRGTFDQVGAYWARSRSAPTLVYLKVPQGVVEAGGKWAVQCEGLRRVTRD